MGSKLWKIKGHCVCHLKTQLPSLLTHPEKGHTIIYLIPPSSLFLSSPACTHPPTQPASRAMNTLRGLRAVLWTTCTVFTWLSRERVRKTGTLNQTGVWFKGTSCEGWISYTSRCCFWSKQRLGAVPGNIYTHCDFFFSKAKMHFYCFMASSSKSVSKYVLYFCTGIKSKYWPK